MLRKEQKRFIVSFLAPPLFLYVLLVIIPAFNALRYSLLKWDGLGDAQFVGLKNFIDLFGKRGTVLNALGHNLFLTIVPGIIILTLSLFFGYVIHQKIRGAKLFRVAFFFPNVISSVAVSLLWILIYSATNAGLINTVLKKYFHLKDAIPFAQSSTLLWALVPMIVWTATGFYMVLFLAAMEAIPEDYYEAARLDGASPTRLFWSITFPLIWEVFTTGVIFLVIGGLKIFDVIWVMENGRPSDTTHTISTLMFSKVYEEYNIGYGTAIAVLLFLLVLCASLVSQKLMRRKSLEY